MKLDIDKDIGMQLPTPKGRTKCIITIFSVLLMMGLIGFFLYQQNYWNFANELQNQRIETKREKETTRASLQQLQMKFNDLKKELIVLSRESSIRQATNKELIRKLLRVEDELTATQNKQLLYKDILAADDQSKGLQIRHFSMQKMGAAADRLYHYTLVLSQAKSRKKILKGRFIIRVQGVEKGKRKTYSHLELAAGGIEAEQNFSLKYYQSLDGDMVLPKGYVPSKASIWIIPSDKELKTQKKSYQWDQLTEQHFSGL